MTTRTIITTNTTTTAPTDTPITIRCSSSSDIDGIVETGSVVSGSVARTTGVVVVEVAAAFWMVSTMSVSAVRPGLGPPIELRIVA